MEIEIEIGAKKTGTIWYGFITGWTVLDDGSLRALTQRVAIEKADRTARKIAEREGFKPIIKIASS